MLSRNLYRRSVENTQYLKFKMSISGKLEMIRVRWKQRKEYKFFSCPSCHTTLRVPRHKGKINIVCKNAAPRSEGKPDMFGYVTANLDQLSQEQRDRYKAFYCGLCRSLGQRHGLPARFTLTYDMTFLVMFLTSLYEPYLLSGQEPCPGHPLSTRRFLQSDISDYAADMNIALAYLNCMDDWHDDINAAALLSAQVLKSEYNRVCAAYPRQCGVIAECMARLKK